MATDWHSLLRSIIPAGVVGTAAFTICTQPAAAFFPPVQNGTNKVTVVPPVSPPVIPPVIPVVPPPPFVPPPPTTVPPVSPPPIIVKPVGVPEPATLVSAAIGLAVVAGASRRKKKDQPTA